MQKLKEYKLKNYGILAVYLFGSEAKGTTTVRSDIDIGIVLKLLFIFLVPRQKGQRQSGVI